MPSVSFWLTILGLGTFLFAACGGEAVPTAIPTPQPTRTPAPIITGIAEPTAVATPVTTGGPTATPIPSPTLQSVPTPEDLNETTATALPTANLIPTPSLAPSPTPVQTPTSTPMLPTQTPSPPPTPVPTSTLRPSSTRVPTPTTRFVRPAGYDIFAPGGLRSSCESDPAPQFTSHITDLSKISYLTPAGTVQGGDLKPHGYLHNQFSASEVPVYAPVDSYLINFAHYQQGGDAIYKLDFQVSCEVAYYFDHLRVVGDKISEVVSEVPAGDSRGIAVAPPLFVEAGEMIGYTGGSSSSRNWDFGVLNTQIWNELPTDKTFNISGNVEKYRFAVCQYEYFEESIQSEYLALLGDQGCGP